jgi:prephenate dehydrogenase
VSPQPIWEKAVIVGVGLLGGSIGLALRGGGLAREVIGVGRPGKPPTGAVNCGAIDRAEEDLSVAARDADLVICCAPVQQIPDLVATSARAMRFDGLITDVGSTKRTIVEEIERLAPTAPFVGSHPLAGGTASGYEHARQDLLCGSLVIVTPSSQTPPERLARTEHLWQSLQAQTHCMSPADHDIALAQTSHLPHIVAAALAAVTPPELLPLTGPGWKGTTRVAKGNAKLWRQILEENRLPALQALENFAKVLEHWRRALESGDGERLEQLLDAGKATRDALGS